MIGTFPDSNSREYYGIAIDLTHGVLISWDGRLIWHGTSMMHHHGNLFGRTLFAAKTKVLVQHGMLVMQRKKEERHSTQVWDMVLYLMAWQMPVGQ